MNTVSGPRITVDARMIGMGGIGRYIGSLLREMMRIRPAVRWTLVGRPERLEEFVSAGAEIRPCHAAPYSAEEAFGMGRFFAGADLVHIPHFNAPLFVGPRLIVTVHDLIHFDYPEYQPFPGANRLLRWRLDRLLKRADLVTTVSQASAAEILRRFPSALTSSKLKVVPEAADPGFTADASPGDADILQGRGIRPPYFLYVGAIREHKEVHTLLAAFASLKERFGGDAQLVLSGRLDRRFEARHGFLATLSRRGDVRWVRDAGDRELAALYRGAVAAVLPSRVEGFGLPLLEAMASGVPAVISDAAALTEVAGGAAMVFPAGQIDRLTDRLYNVLSDQTLREKLSISGRRRAADFSWSKAAAATLELYDRLL